jgi:hypothetical protein
MHTRIEKAMSFVRIVVTVSWVSLPIIFIRHMLVQRSLGRHITTLPSAASFFGLVELSMKPTKLEAYVYHEDEGKK